MTLYEGIITAIIHLMKIYSYLFFMVLFILLTGCNNETESSPEITTSPQITTIVNIGSDTLVNLALAWAEEYHQLYPNVEISVTGGGSGTGIAALINGTVDIANASRQIKPEEIQQAEDNGVKPVEFIVAKDAIAIIVNPNNPVNHLTISQLSDIYSGKINNWSEVGGEDRVIIRLSRETNSGTHVFFLENVIRKGNPDNKTLFSSDTLLLPSSEGITAETRDNPNAIGYDGLGYVTPDVKVIAIARDTMGPFILPSAETVILGQYPIARDLYMYTNNQPKGAIADYLNWIVTTDAQNIVTQLGFVPINTP
jgi:phosphate transport system substrate-binding protein